MRPDVRGAAEKRCDDALLKSAACEQVFGIRITAKALQAELDRMVRETQRPDILRSLFEAVDHDAASAAEVIARPLLADRLLRSAYANDKKMHEEAWRDAERILEEVKAGRPWPEGIGSRLRIVVRPLSSKEEARQERPRIVEDGSVLMSPEEWRRQSFRWPPAGSPPRLIHSPEGVSVALVREGGSGELLGESLLVPFRSFDLWWAEARRSLRRSPTRAESLAGLRLPVVPDAASCNALSVWSGQPSGRHGASAVWTGTEMIFWGGETEDPYARGGGGRLDPVTGAYHVLPEAPSNVNQAMDSVAVWTGSAMAMFKVGHSQDEKLNGALYFPDTDSWTEVSLASGCPPNMTSITAVWTGKEILVWGTVTDYSDSYTAGGRYDPSTDTWLPMSQQGAPTPRLDHQAVWTGEEMIVFGGAPIGFPYTFVTGGLYNPTTDTWRPTPVQPATPEAYSRFSCVWTGSEMIVWGGDDDSYDYISVGGRYDPVLDVWSSMSSVNVPEARAGHTAVWTGTEMIVWGGVNRGPSGHGQEVMLRSGARYSPDRDEWTPLPTDGWCPSERMGHVAIWTGAAMVVWSGLDYSTGYNDRRNDGGLYDPASDEWSNLPLGTVNTHRVNACTEWTGAEWILWGGMTYYSRKMKSGGIFDPATACWRPMAEDWNTPAYRLACVHLWTGQEMLVWGGIASEDGSGVDAATWSGGRYDPALDRWRRTSEGPGTPEARYGHCAAWTGEEMIVWGGQNAWGVFLDSGGMYDPVANRWRALPTGGACPTPRANATATWTGSETIIWGGRITNVQGDDTLLADGAKLSSDAATWEAIPQSQGSPSGRYGHSALWTGDSLLIWGGQENVPVNAPGTGGRFFPSRNEWTSTSTSGACPISRSFCQAIWTGTRMLAQGGTMYNYTPSFGALYDPDGDVWEPLPAPSSDTLLVNIRSQAPADPILLYEGGERAGWTYRPCLSARFLHSMQAGSASGTVAFTASAFGGTRPYEWLWDFGDGTTGTGEMCVHVYASPGTYTATLTARDAAGEEVATTRTVTVLPPPVISSVQNRANPFRLTLAGTGFQQGARVTINGAPAPETTVVSGSEITVGKGSSLKALLPKGQAVQVRVSNPDGQFSVVPYTRTARRPGGEG
ncbi:MAG: Kelch repeat-containing protein [Acidobacteriota bacterium]